MVYRQSELTRFLSVVVGTTPGRRSHAGVDAGAEGRDDELLTVCANFQAVDEELSRLVECDADPPEQEFMDLHSTWSEGLSQATVLTAHTADGLRAKAAVLLAAMTVVLEPNHRDAAPHELLAASLARDLNARTVPDVRSGGAFPATDDDAVRNI